MGSTGQQWRRDTQNQAGSSIRQWLGNSVHGHISCVSTASLKDAQTVALVLGAEVSNGQELAA